MKNDVDYRRFKRSFFQSEEWITSKPLEKEIYFYLQFAGLRKGNRIVKYAGKIVRGQCVRKIETIMKDLDIKLKQTVLTALKNLKKRKLLIRWETKSFPSDNNNGYFTINIFGVQNVKATKNVIILHHETILSDEWRSLTHSAKHLYIILKSLSWEIDYVEEKYYDCFGWEEEDHYDLCYEKTKQQIQKIAGISRQVYCRARKELIEKGFIKKTKEEPFCNYYYKDVFLVRKK